MSQSDIKEVLNRTMQDEESLDEFRANPDEALEEYDLSEEEEELLKDGEYIDVMDDDAAVDEGAAPACVCVVVVVVTPGS